MYFFSRGGWLGAVYVFFFAAGAVYVFFFAEPAGWGPCMYFFSLRGWAVLGFFALGEKGSHFASFNKGFGSKTGLLEAHIMAGWGRGSIFIWRAVYVFFFAGRPAGGRVCIFFAAGAVLVFFGGAGWPGPC